MVARPWVLRTHVSPAWFPSEGMPTHVLKTPVNITLRRLAHGSDTMSATWNFSLLGGQGGWQSDGCRILGHYDNFTTISCNSLGNYGLLMVGGDDGSRGACPNGDEMLQPL